MINEKNEKTQQSLANIKNRMLKNLKLSFKRLTFSHTIVLQFKL